MGERETPMKYVADLLLFAAMVIGTPLYFAACAILFPVFLLATLVLVILGGGKDGRLVP
jgi:hypothetical protein